MPMSPTFPDAQARCEGIQGTDMPMPVVWQAGSRPSSGYCPRPVRHERPSSEQACDGGGPCAAPRRGRSGEEDTLHTQDSERSEDKSERDHPGRSAPRERGSGGRLHRLRGSVRSSSFVHTDDTGWRVGGESAFLMVFETDEATVYQVRPRHRNEEVRVSRAAT